MSDKKISQLTAATTPLAGTEVLPIVQGTTTVKVANNDLRPKQIQSNATSGVVQVVGPAAGATRVMTIPDANFTAARTDSAQTFTGTQTFAKIISNTTTNRFEVTSTNNGGYATTKYTAKNSTGTTVGFEAGINQFSDNTYELADTVNTALAYRYTSGGAGAWQFYVNSSAKLKLDGTTSDVTVNQGNLVIGTSGKGIDFSATADGSGTMTSELLNDYEEGTWTPVDANVGPGLLPLTASGTYVKIGKTVYTFCQITYPTNAYANAAYIGGLPYAQGNATYAGGYVPYNTTSTALSTTGFTSDTMILSSLVSSTAVSLSSVSGATIRIVFIYTV